MSGIVMWASASTSGHVEEAAEDAAERAERVEPAIACNKFAANATLTGAEQSRARLVAAVAAAAKATDTPRVSTG